MMKKNEMEKIINRIERRQKQYNVLLVIIVLIALLLSAISLGVNFAKEPEKGEQGIQGIQGVQGEKGINGYQGPIGLKGEKGDKGDTGSSGSKGETGSQGPRGKDCPPNQKPIIMLKDFNGIRISKCTEFTFYINVTITDPDDDSLQIDFYFSEENNTGWIHHKTFFGTDDIYGASIQFRYPYIILYKTLYVQVVVWDGSDLSLRTYDYTIY